MYGSTSPRSVSILKVRICTSVRSFTFLYNSSRCGSSSLHGPHQVAQRLTRTDLPSRVASFQVLPERSASSNAGSVLSGFLQRPSLSSSAFAVGGLLQTAYATSVPPIASPPPRAALGAGGPRPPPSPRARGA